MPFLEMMLETIALYAGGPVEEVELEDEYKALSVKYARDGVFEAFRRSIADSKRRLESTLDDQFPRLQVGFALKEVYRHRNSAPEIREAVAKLILDCYGPNWSGEQRAYFQDWSVRLLHSQDYFLSFTNRHPTPGEANIINVNHEYFIRTYVTDFAQRKTKSNLLAHAIHLLLQSSRFRLKGFYYEQHDEESYIVEERLRKECERALVFFQIVQGDMFLTAPSYCHFEYDVAQRSVPAKEFVYLLAEDGLIADDRVIAEFVDWYGDISSRAPAALKSTRLRRSTTDIEANIERVRVKVASLIEDARKHVYDNVPM